MRCFFARSFAPLLLVAAAAPARSPQEPPPPPQQATFAVRAERVHTMAGAVIEDGVVVVERGKVRAVGKAADLLPLPSGVLLHTAKVLVPGLIDAHSTVGLSGLLNIPHDQDQLDNGGPVQPELRAIDAFNAREELVAWLRGFGITTVHTGHGPGALVSGQTMVVKTAGRTVEQDVVKAAAMLAATLGDGARGGEGRSRGGDGGGKGPGTRAKAVAMLREELIKAGEYRDKRAREPNTPRDLRLDVLVQVLDRELPLLVTAHRHNDLLSALRIAREFGLQLVLDGAAEAYLVLPEIKQAGCWVLPHPTMARTSGELQNGTMELPKLLADAGIPFALQSGFEGYVPKTRVVLFEAGVAVGHGLSFDAALAALTIDAARLLGVDARIGSLAVGKDADLAWFDGDPFEYTTHCLGVSIDGMVFAGQPR